MALQGSIKDFGLPDIFQLIGLQRKTGILTLRHEDETVTVTFENGMVVHADTSAKRMEDRLGSLLVKQGKLPEDKLDEILQRQKATLQRIGHILISSNLITAKDLKDALQVQVSQTVFKLFRWKEGDYHFEPQDKVEFDRANFSPMSADFILMEGIRMLDEWPIIEKKIPTMDIVFRAAVDPALIEAGADLTDSTLQNLGASKQPRPSASNKIRLSAEEERVFRRVDGERTVQSIIDVTGMGDFDTCKALYDLLCRNIVAPVGRGRGGAAVEAVAEEPSKASPVLGYGLLAAALGLALIGVFLRREAPFAVSGRPPYLRAALGSVLEGVSRARLARLDRALQAYRLAHRAPARTLEEVVAAGLVDGSYVRDPWDRPYHYGLSEGGYVLNAVDDAGRTVAGTTIERSFPPARP